MNIKTRINRTFSLCSTLVGVIYAGDVAARELGVLPTIPPGATMGVPIAAPTPIDGIFLGSRSGVVFQNLYDQNGDKTDTEVTIKDTVLQLTMAPGFELLGGQYRAYLAVPFIDVEGEKLATPFGPTDASNSGLGSIEIRPMDISWEISPGIYMNAGMSAYTPGDWSETELVNAGQNFWSLSPSVGFSYTRNNWNTSAHLLYFINDSNEDNDYKSGDELHLNLTAMKTVANKLSVGAVGYVRKQVEEDENPEGAYGGAVFGEALSTGVGVSVTKQLGPVNLNVMFTTELETENTSGGERIWFNAIIPIKVFGQ